MRRALLAAGLMLAMAALLPAPAAQAHPLGNFSINHITEVSVSPDKVQALYILDQAEIPTVQERGLGRAEVLRRKLDEVRRGLHLTAGGRHVPLAIKGDPNLTFPEGAGGLTTTRLELTLDAAV